MPKNNGEVITITITIEGDPAPSHTSKMKSKDVHMMGSFKGFPGWVYDYVLHFNEQ